MPLANRTAERLWKLSQIGRPDASDDSCRQLLAIAKDHRKDAESVCLYCSGTTLEQLLQQPWVKKMDKTW